MAYQLLNKRDKSMQILFDRKVEGILVLQIDRNYY